MYSTNFVIPVKIRQKNIKIIIIGNDQEVYEEKYCTSLQVNSCMYFSFYTEYTYAYIYKFLSMISIQSNEKNLEKLLII